MYTIVSTLLNIKIIRVCCFYASEVKAINEIQFAYIHKAFIHTQCFSKQQMNTMITILMFL